VEFKINTSITIDVREAKIPSRHVFVTCHARTCRCQIDGLGVEFRGSEHIEPYGAPSVCAEGLWFHADVDHMLHEFGGTDVTLDNAVTIAVDPRQSSLVQ
jgi:hypothetical protein